jgi:hypothetical protein
VCVRGCGGGTGLCVLRTNFVVLCLSLRFAYACFVMEKCKTEEDKKQSERLRKKKQS